MSLYPNLNPSKALIWRIVHRDNLPWILENGLHCPNSASRSPRWVNIGNTELIDRRGHKAVNIPPGGVLNDYVPFYFTPFSPMLYNIYTGRGGVPVRRNEEIVILVSSLYKVSENGHAFIFSDRHAYIETAQFYSDLNKLDVIDWDLLQNRNFQRSADDPEKVERYQAEALIYRHLPVSSLLGAVCYTDAVKQQLSQIASERGLNLNIHRKTEWYF